MTERSAGDHPGSEWFKLALAALFAITLIRILVVFSTPVPLFFDEAQYWTWAQDLAFGYYSKPPMVAWAIAATTSVCGVEEGCVRLSAPLVHGATAIVMYLLGRHFYDARSAFWAAITYAVLPGVSLSAVIVSTDVFLLFFWALAFYAFLKADQNNAAKWWVTFGVALGLGLLSKYAMVFFLLCLVADDLWQKNNAKPTRRPGLWTALVIAALLYAPNLWWNWVNGFPSYRHTAENMNLGTDLFNPLSAVEFVGGQFGVFGPLLFAAFSMDVLAIVGVSFGKTRAFR